MKRTLFPVIILMACTTLLYQSDACAHGFAGKRFFPATLTTDDPFVADEASLPTVSTIRMPGEGESPETRETGISVDLAKRITPHFGWSWARHTRSSTPRAVPRKPASTTWRRG